MKLPLLSVVFAVAALVARADVKSTINETHPLNADAEVVLENVNGYVEITGWDKNEVTIVAEKSAPTQEDLDRIDVQIEASPGRLTIKTQRKKKSFLDGSWKGQVTYRLNVPRRAQLEKISVVNAKVSVRDVSGEMSIESVNGEIEARGAAANGNFRSVNGSLNLQYAQLSSVEKIEINTVNGSCHLAVPKNPSFRVEGDTVNGGARYDFPVTTEKAGRGDFRAHVGEGGPHIRFNAVNGELRMSAK